MARRLSALGGSLTVSIAIAALLVAGAGVAGAGTQTPAGPFIVTPTAGIPSRVPCGTVAEFTAPAGIQFPAAETPSILAALGLPAGQAPYYVAEFKQLGTFLSWLSIPTPPCGSEVVVGE